jgi:hypothetical protein
MRLCDVISTQGDGDSADDNRGDGCGTEPSATFLADASSTEESSEGRFHIHPADPGNGQFTNGQPSSSVAHRGATSVQART